ncbi:MAG: reverse gyrase [Candidatus Bathyarchaeia archaeon]
MRSIYNGLCINCKGFISDDRLLKWGICERCLGDIEDVKNFRELLNVLIEHGKLYFAKDLLSFQSRFSDFSKFFKKAVGQRMWSLQEAWAKRIILGRSFSIVAPTGVGKTVLGIVSALYFATKENKKSYIIVPTALLVQQVVDKLRFFSERLNVSPIVLYYHGALRDSEKREVLENTAKGCFNILVTTDRFLIDHFDIVRGNTFDFVFVDDVDSFLKSPKNIDKILLILGFDEKIITSAFNLLDLVKEANRLRRIGKSPDELLKKIESIRGRIEQYKRNGKMGLLVVSGATMRAKRTKRIQLFHELLDFQIGFKPEFLRNIKDFYMEAEATIEEQVLKIIKVFGGGCLLFVPSTAGKEQAIRLDEYLRAHGIKSKVYMKMDEKLLENFQSGEYDVLIGVASFRSPLARGIDLPERIRYVIFAGVPRLEIKLSWDEYSPSKILTLLKNIREFLDDKAQEKATQLINNIRRILPLNRRTLDLIRSAVGQGLKLEGFEGYVCNLILNARQFLKEAITPEVVAKISQSKEVSLKRKDGEFYLIVADPTAYVQASGRASRLFAGGITRGASILLVDDEKAFYSLKRRLSFMMVDVSWIKFNTKIASKWFEKIDEDRKIIQDIKAGKIVKRIKDFIKTALLVVESPTKARTISKFFGKPSKRRIGGLTVFEVSMGEFMLNIVASMGHIYDLVIENGFHGVKVEEKRFVPIYDFINKCRKCGEQFSGLEFCPKCKSTDFQSKKDIVEALRALALEVNYIFIATDPDIEGEKIAYDIYCSLYPLNRRIERLEFHEITKKAFIQAIKRRRNINFRMVEAQIVRRIEDRWIGFELSRKLWIKFRNYRLSAGRVQTPVLGWIIDRTLGARKKKKVLFATLSNNLRVSFENPTLPFPQNKLADSFKDLRAKITGLEEEERVINPPPPYTTDTMLRDASTKLNFSASKAMMLAQDLFEMGLCTYHRTDATTVSTTGINVAREYLQDKYPLMLSPKRYAMEGAHECIRPTRPIDVQQLKNLISLGLLRFPKKLTHEHLQLYDLIFTRFITSQMKAARVLYQKFRVTLDGNETSVEHPIKIIEDGFNLLAPIKLAQPVHEGEYTLKDAKMVSLPAVSLFKEGEVIALMKERGIGRPSTYSKIISTILDRRYVITVKNKLVSTKLGLRVYEYLSSNFTDYVSEETTRRLESIIDAIEQGRVDYQEVLRNLYNEILRIREEHPSQAAYPY